MTLETTRKRPPPFASPLQGLHADFHPLAARRIAFFPYISTVSASNVDRGGTP